MALIRYEIDQNGTATPTVLEVNIGDRIQFSSKNSNVAIKFQGMSPFKGRHAPAANQTFEVGKGKKGPFRIAVTSNHKIKFKCIPATGGVWGTKNGKARGGFIPPGSGGSNDN